MPPDLADQFKREANIERGARDILCAQLMYLARGDAAYGKAGNENEDLRAFGLILNIGTCRLGDVITQVCLEKIYELKRKQASSLSKAVPKQLIYCEENDVVFGCFQNGMTNLLDAFQEKGYLAVPSQSEGKQTSMAATAQHVDAFSPAKHQHLGWLAEILACES